MEIRQLRITGEEHKSDKVIKNPALHTLRFVRNSAGESIFTSAETQSWKQRATYTGKQAQIGRDNGGRGGGKTKQNGETLLC